MVFTRCVLVLAMLLPWMSGCGHDQTNDARGGSPDVALTQDTSGENTAPAKRAGFQGQFTIDPFAGVFGFLWSRAKPRSRNFRRRNPGSSGRRRQTGRRCASAVQGPG